MVHSLVAKLSYPDIIKDTKIEDIKKLFPQQRQDAKGIEFAINYGGDFHTISSNKHIPILEAKAIYENYMKGFKGVAKYQDYCRMAVKRDKYILLNPVTGHRFFIWDLDKLIAVEDGSDRSSESLDYYDKRISELEKCSINYRIQNRGACTFKLASILFFNYLKRNNLLGTVKYCLAVHDEVDLEAPEAMKDEIAAKLIKCMENGAKPFCTKLHLSADVSIGDYWIH